MNQKEKQVQKTDDELAQELLARLQSSFFKSEAQTMPTEEAVEKNEVVAQEETEEVDEEFDEIEQLDELQETQTLEELGALEELPDEVEEVEERAQEDELEFEFVEMPEEMDKIDETDEIEEIPAETAVDFVCEIPSEVEMIIEEEVEEIAQASDEPDTFTFDEIDAATPAFRPTPAQQAKLDSYAQEAAFYAKEEIEETPAPKREEATPRSLDGLEMEAFTAENYREMTFDELVTEEAPTGKETDLAAWEAPPVVPHKPKKEKKERVIYEYIEDFQRDGIMKKYRNQDRRIFFRLIVAAILCVVAFFYDVTCGILPEFLSPQTHAGTYLIVGDLLCVLSLACAWKSVFESVKQLLEGKLQPQLFLPLAYILIAIYQIVSAAAGALPMILHTTWYLCVLCVACVFQERLEMRREVYAFAQMSQDGEKILLQQQGNVCYTTRANFFSDFYHRSTVYPSQRRQILWYLCAAVAVPIFFLILTLCMDLSVWSALRCTYLAFLCAMPVSFLFFYTVPQYFLAQKAYLADSMMLCEETACDLAKTKRFDLNDDTVLDAEKIGVSDFKIYENFRIDRAMYYLASALSPLQCALSKAICHGVREMGYSASANVVELQTDGVCTIVDERTHVEFGTVDYMRRKHYLIAPTAPSQMARNETVGVAYLAVDAKIVATMQIHYAVNAEFLPRLVKCSQNEINLVVRTVDPILNEAILRRNIPGGNRYRIFLQKMPSCPKHEAQHSGVGMTTNANELSLIDMILECKKVAEQTRKLHLLPILSMIVSLFLMAPIQNVIIENPTHMSWLPILYQAVSCGIGMLIVYFKQLKDK
jgi:hypothetical protein